MTHLGSIRPETSFCSQQFSSFLVAFHSQLKWLWPANHPKSIFHPAHENIEAKRWQTNSDTTVRWWWLWCRQEFPAAEPGTRLQTPQSTVTLVEMQNFHSLGVRAVSSARTIKEKLNWLSMEFRSVLESLNFITTQLYISIFQSNLLKLVFISCGLLHYSIQLKGKIWTTINLQS